MSFGTKMIENRKKRGFTQEEVACQLGVSRQTISKWELDITIPDIYQVKKMAQILALSIEQFVEENSMPEIEEILINTTAETVNQTNWTDAWSKKYPVLKRYQEEMDVPKYRQEIRNLLEEIKMKYQYSELDAMLVLKDVLYHEWKDSKR